MARTTPTDRQQLRMLTDAVRDFALVIVALDGTIVSWNPGAVGVYGYAGDDIVGSNISRLFTEADVTTSS